MTTNHSIDRHMKDVKLSEIKIKCKRNHRNIFEYDVILVDDKKRLIKTIIHDNDGIRYLLR